MKLYNHRRLSCLLCLLMITTAVAFGRQQSGVKEEVDKLYAAGLKFLLQPDSLIGYADKGYRLAKSIGYRDGEANHLKLKGVYEHRKGNLDQAIATYNESLSIFRELGNELECGKLNLNIATSYNAKSDFINSTSYALQALKGFEKTNFLSGQGRVLNLLGITSFSQKDYQGSKSYFLRYSELVKQAKDTVEIASSYNNIGSAYQYLGKLDSAINYFNQAIRIHRARNNATGVGIVYENIGNIFQDTKKDPARALIYYKKSLDAFSSIGANQRMGHGYLNLGITYGKLKDTVQAKKMINQAIVAARNSGDKEILQKAYENLSSLEAGNDQFRAAYQNLKTSLGHSDSIWSGERLKVVEELKTRYDTEKKEMQIKTLAQQNTIQQLEIRQRNYLLLIGSFIFVAALLIAYLVYSRQQLKAESRLQGELNKQQDAAARAVLQAEERERQRIAADLHDGVGQVLSTALLNMKSLLKKLALSGSEEQQAARSLALITESYNEVRSISHQMIPNALIKSGLVSAVRDFLETVNSEQLEVILSVSGLAGSLGEQTETILYRVLQESVNNVIKYARASKLHVQLVKDEDGITLSVEDNGVGFDLATAIKGNGIGLQNIRSRVGFLKGTVDFESKPGKGTMMLVSIPG